MPRHYYACCRLIYEIYAPGQGTGRLWGPGGRSSVSTELVLVLGQMPQDLQMHLPSAILTEQFKAVWIALQIPQLCFFKRRIPNTVLESFMSS